MGKIRVMSVFGTRPEATKMGPLIKALERDGNFESLVCVTAQHRSLLDEVLELFGITPDYDLNIMIEGQTLEYITVSALSGLSAVIDEAKPDLILVHGDPTTAFAGALAAFYKGVKLGHVEAGLRTYDKFQPYPEEINRKLVGSLADIHFAPTELTKSNLLKENISEDIIYVTGNTAVDCAKNSYKADYVFSRDMLNTIDYENKKVITVTAHRKENLGKPLENICHALMDIVNQHEDVEIIYPVHPNPAVKNTAHRILDEVRGVHVIDAIDFVDLHNLMARSFMVLSDSGGLQEEASVFNKPVLVLRNVTERPEGIEAGILKLAGTDRNAIVEKVNELITNTDEYNRMVEAKNPFGDGYASEKIVEAIKDYFSVSEVSST